MQLKNRTFFGVLLGRKLWENQRAKLILDFLENFVGQGVEKVGVSYLPVNAFNVVGEDRPFDPGALRYFYLNRITSPRLGKNPFWLTTLLLR
jgi:hypothetical protein